MSRPARTLALLLCLLASAPAAADRVARPPSAPRRAASGSRGFARLPIPDLYPEGLAVEPGTGRTFLSSLGRGGVLEVREGGRWRWFVKPAPDGPWETLGLKVDAARGWLWMASNGHPGRAGLDRNAAARSALLAVDLVSGQVQRRIECAREGRHLLNDLALGEDGSVYVTDSEAGAVYRVPPGEDRFQPVLPPGSLEYPNGILLAEGERGLLVAAQGGTGLYSVPLPGGPPRPIRVPPGLDVRGIDGMTRAGGRIVAIQNGRREARILLLQLEQEGAALGSLRELRQGLRDIPTTGDLAGRSFRFVENSQMDLLDRPAADRRPAPFLVSELPLPD